MNNARRRETSGRLVLALMLGTAAAVLAAFSYLIVDGDIARAQTAPDDPESRIVGGTAVPDGKYPFVTAVLDKNIQGTAYEKQFCGGTLIDSNKVLTAAHCVSGAAAQDLQTATGRTVLDSDQGQLRNVSRIDVHPQFDASAGTYEYDAAVLTLQRPVNNVQSVNLAGAAQDNLEQPGQSATVAGWGNTEKQPAGGFGGQNFPNRMQEARVPLISDTEARQSYSNYVSELMVAAGKVGKDSCQGDSGGPMFARTPNGPTQIGITSFGTGCGAQDFPGVYAEVNAPAVSNFIDSQLGDSSQAANIEQSNNRTVSIEQSDTQSSNQTAG